MEPPHTGYAYAVSPNRNPDVASRTLREAIQSAFRENPALDAISGEEVRMHTDDEKPTNLAKAMGCSTLRKAAEQLGYSTRDDSTAGVYILREMDAGALTTTPVGGRPANYEGGDAHPGARDDDDVDNNYATAAVDSDVDPRPFTPPTGKMKEKKAPTNDEIRLVISQAIASRGGMINATDLGSLLRQKHSKIKPKSGGLLRLVRKLGFATIGSGSKFKVTYKRVVVDHPSGGDQSTTARDTGAALSLRPSRKAPGIAPKSKGAAGPAAPVAPPPTSEIPEWRGASEGLEEMSSSRTAFNAGATVDGAGMYRPFHAGVGLDGHRRPLHARGLLPSNMSYGYLGVVNLTKEHDLDESNNNHDSATPPAQEEHLFLNTQDPFCAVACGVQGSGKSHTLGVLLENCLISPGYDDSIRLSRPMSVLAFHFDRSPHNHCEITGILNATNASGISHPRDNTIVLVSPDDYHRRKSFYGDTCDVHPLLFSWRDLTATDLLVLMRVNSKDTQLYMANMLNLLRGYQRLNKLPDFDDFVEEVRATCCSSPSQSGPLEQRLALLSSVIAESKSNVALRAHGMDVRRALLGHGRDTATDSSVPNGDDDDGGDKDPSSSSGKEKRARRTLIIADMTDAMRTGEEANGIFQVLLEQFRGARLPDAAGKVLLLDEAHKFVSGDDGLTEGIVDCVRLMRHEGLRVIIGTQSPEVLSPELLELVTMVFVHKLQSRRWFRYLADKVVLPDSTESFMRAVQQSSGYALLATSAEIVTSSGRVFSLGGASILMRPRITEDRGSSRTHCG